MSHLPRPKSTGASQEAVPIGFQQAQKSILKQKHDDWGESSAAASARMTARRGRPAARITKTIPRAGTADS